LHKISGSDTRFAVSTGGSPILSAGDLSGSPSCFPVAVRSYPRPLRERALRNPTKATHIVILKKRRIRRELKDHIFFHFDEAKKKA
jgi:hypothetical protein